MRQNGTLEITRDGDTVGHSQYVVSRHALLMFEEHRQANMVTPWRYHFTAEKSLRYDEHRLLSSSLLLQSRPSWLPLIYAWRRRFRMLPAVMVTSCLVIASTLARQRLMNTTRRLLVVESL